MRPILLVALPLMLAQVTGCDQPPPPAPPTADTVTATARPETPPQSDTGEASRQALFGDLHVHSSWSLDGYIFGNNNDPRAAYRFARGESVPLAGGETSRQLRVPLDFTAVTDHAETLGYHQRCMVDKTAASFNTETCRMTRERDLRMYFTGFRNLAKNPPQHLAEVCSDNADCRQAATAPWQQLQAIANEYNQPGEFTTFKAYEYTGNLPGGGMLHRNVIFAGDAAPDEAMSAFDLPSARELWSWLERDCTGDCDVITIPHNSNLAWGNTFATRNVDGSDWTDEDHRRRQHYDRLVEIFQAKGNSECQTGIGSNDEFCDFELLLRPCAEGEEVGCMQQTSFVRNGLKTGLQLDRQLGFNPYQYGIIASTDTHNGTPGDTREQGYEGHQSGETTIEHRLTGGHRVKEGRGAINYNPGGLVGAWAEENTRESLFAAFKRRETFGTSGNRTRIRLFAGLGYPADLAGRPDAIRIAYEQGVPMGATLPITAKSSAPDLLVWAAQDPDSLPLQRLQVIKGWVDDSGESRELTYDVACSDGLAVDPQTHRCPDNGAGVNPADCTPTGNAGAPQLASLWRDPDFDPGQRAFYYARVLENPGCRWSSYDILAAGDSITPAYQVPRVIQERAWSSPVWLQPTGEKPQ
jgi:hypothetical protein